MSNKFPLSEVLSDADIFTDGDWVESKDQDPNGDVRLVQLADVGDGKWIDKSARFLTSAKAKELKCTFLESGDLLVARMPDPLGRCCIFPGSEQSCVTVVDVCVIRPNPARVSSKYLMRVINSSVGRQGIARHITGTTRKRISRKNLAKVTIPLPSLQEQKRIAGILDAADALRVKRRDAIASLDTLLQSTFLTLFGDPVTNPMGWKAGKLREIGESRLGKMLDKRKQIGDCQFPYLANFNVQWGRFELSTLRCMDFNEADRKEFELRHGDLLVCEGGEVGRTAIWRGERENIYFQKALHRIRLEPMKATPEYFQFYMWFMAQNGGFQDFTNSATIAHLTGVKLKKLSIPIPPIDLQQHFTTIVQSIEKQKSQQRAHLSELDTLFASLQSRAFKGEL